MPSREARDARRYERQRLSDRLHDDVQQLLVGAQLQIQAVIQLEDDADKRAMLNTAAHCLRQAVDATRHLAIDLSPPVQLENGFVPALEWLSNWMEKNHNLRCKIEEADADIIDGDLASILFDCVRQLSLNAVKHAGVDSISLRVTRNNDGLCVIVRDEGCGFDPDVVDESDDPTTGFGLAKIRREIEAVRGRFQIDSAPGRGTSATLWIPMDESPEMIAE